MAPPSAAAAAAAGGLVLWLHGSAETGEQSRAQVARYFSAVPDLRLSFPTAPTTPIACYGTRS
jgi:lysophospholipase-2